MTYHSVGSHGLKREKKRTNDLANYTSWFWKLYNAKVTHDQWIRSIYKNDLCSGWWWTTWLMFDTNNATDLDVVLTQCLIYTFPLVKSKSVKNCFWITTVTHKKREKKKKVLLFLSFNVVSTFNVRSNFLHSDKMKRFLNDIGYDIHPWANLLDSVSSVKVKPQSLQW